MSDTSARRPLALTATIATSVAAAAGMIAPAHATTASPAGIAKLTLSGGSTSGPAQSGDLDGTKYGLTYADKATDLAWSPTGARAVWVDPTSGQVLTGTPGGAHTAVAPAVPNGTTRHHPTFIDGGARVVWSESATGGNAALKWAYADGLDTDGNGAPVVHDFRSQKGVDFFNPDAVGNILVYQINNVGAGPEIHVMDLAQPNAAPYKVAAGWDPTVSPDGKTVAFINNVGNVDNIYTVSTANPGSTLANPQPITGQGTGTPHSFRHPVWTPDGKALVFEWLDAQQNDLDTQSVTVGSAPSTTYTQVVPGMKTTGLPAFQPIVRGHVTRLAGTDRLDTAIKVSQSYWKTAGTGGNQAHAVVLSRSDQFADALGGSALAAKVGGPLLMTPTGTMNQAVQAEIQRVLGPGDGAKTVYILGGTAALSPTVEKALKTLNYHVQRVWGLDRYETAVQIADTITGPGGTPDYILVATGKNFPDALAAGAAAGEINAHQGKKAVVILTNDTVMPKPSIDYIAPLNARTVIDPVTHLKPANFIELDTIGHQAEVAIAPPPGSPNWIPAGFQAGQYYALSGLDRYQTSEKVAAYFFTGVNAAGLATGTNWADALSGGALMAMQDGPLLLVNPTQGPGPDVAKWLSGNSAQFAQVDIFGGTGAVAGSVDQGVANLIAGPGGVDFPSNPKVG